MFPASFRRRTARIWLSVGSFFFGILDDTHHPALFFIPRSSVFSVPLAVFLNAVVDPLLFAFKVLPNTFNDSASEWTIQSLQSELFALRLFLTREIIKKPLNPGKTRTDPL